MFRALSDTLLQLPDTHSPCSDELLHCITHALRGGEGSDPFEGHPELLLRASRLWLHDAVIDQAAPAFQGLRLGECAIGAVLLAAVAAEPSPTVSESIDAVLEDCVHWLRWDHPPWTDEALLRLATRLRRLLTARVVPAVALPRAVGLLAQATAVHASEVALLNGTACRLSTAAVGVGEPDPVHARRWGERFIARERQTLWQSHNSACAIQLALEMLAPRSCRLQQRYGAAFAGLSLAECSDRLLGVERNQPLVAWSESVGPRGGRLRDAAAAGAPPPPAVQGLLDDAELLTWLERYFSERHGLSFLERCVTTHGATADPQVLQQLLRRRDLLHQPLRPRLVQVDSHWHLLVVPTRPLETEYACGRVEDRAAPLVLRRCESLAHAVQLWCFVLREVFASRMEDRLDLQLALADLGELARA